MIRVGVSGAAGRMGRMAAAAVDDSEDLELAALYAPGHEGESVVGHGVSADPDALEGCEVVVELTRPDVVMGNLRSWRSLGAHVVAGTSGFDAARLAEVRRDWAGAAPNLLVVPNFSIGAVVMMRFAELAAPHFQASEIIELHHDGKVDAPSGTALATAGRMGAGSQRRAVDSEEEVDGARGGEVGGVRIHSVRLPGLLAHQEVVLGNPGEVLTVRHDTTDRVSFMPGLLAAVRAVPNLPGVTVGLDRVLGI